MHHATILPATVSPSAKKSLTGVAGLVDHRRLDAFASPIGLEIGEDCEYTPACTMVGIRPARSLKRSDQKSRDLRRVQQVLVVATRPWLRSSSRSASMPVEKRLVEHGIAVRPE